MPLIKTVTLIEIDDAQFSKKYLGDMLPAIESLARVYSEHGSNIDNAQVLELDDPETGHNFAVYWDDLEELAAELPNMLI